MPFAGDEQADTGYHSDKCIIVKIRVVSAALGGPWEILFLSQGSGRKELAKSGPCSSVSRKTRGLVCEPLGPALQLITLIVGILVRGWFCFPGIWGKASVHVSHLGRECILGSGDKLGWQQNPPNNRLRKNPLWAGISGGLDG